MSEFTEEQVAAMLEKDTRKLRKELERLEAIANTDSRITLIKTCADHGIEIENGDVLAAGQRVLDKLAADQAKLDSDAAAWRDEHTANHEAAVAPILAERDGLRGEITDRRIDHELTTAAKARNAYNPEQVVALVRDKAIVLPNGEVVFKDVMPSALQSAAEVVDFLSVDKPNLFTENLFPKGRR